MEVYYDFELDDNLEKPLDINNTFHKDLREFIEKRYEILKDEISMFSTEEVPIFIVLCIEKEGLRIKEFNAPPHLKQKIKDCMTEEDYNFIIDTIYWKILNEYRKN